MSVFIRYFLFLFFIINFAVSTFALIFIFRIKNQRGLETGKPNLYYFIVKRSKNKIQALVDEMELYKDLAESVYEELNFKGIVDGANDAE